VAPEAKRGGSEGGVSPEEWARVKDLFHEALERRAEEREAFLDDRCGADAPLRQAVVALLDSHERAGAFLETSTGVDRAAAGLLGYEEAAQALAPGAHVGPYEVVALLDAGGVGEVYRARDPRLGRDVAVKVLQAHYSKDAERLRRFESEARTAGAISHPNILTVFDVGWALGAPYLVSELLEGETLGQRLARDPMGFREAVECAVQIASGLEAAHAKGIVHRDLKPDNVFLTKQGAVKILDFGVAKLLSEPGAVPRETSGIERGGGSTLMGTPGYIAPEQLEGGVVDHRADVFALGALLYRTVTGRPAFPEGATTERLGATAAGEPQPFSPRDGVPAALQRIVRRCLERRPEARFQSAHEVKAALDGLLRRSPSRRRLRVLVVGAAAVCLLALVGLRLRETRRAPDGRVRSLAVLPIEGPTPDGAQQYLADGMTDGLITEIGRAGSDGLRVIARGSVMGLRGSKEPLPRIGDALGVESLVVGKVGRNGDEVRLTLRLLRAATGEELWSGDYSGRISEIGSLQRSAAEAISEQVAPARRRPPTAPGREPTSIQAYEAYLRGRYYWNRRTEEDVRRAIDEFNRALALDPLYAQAYTGLADAFVSLGDVLYLMPSADAFARAEAASLRALELDPTQAEAHATLGHLRMHAWRWREAEAEFQSAIRLYPGYATAHHWRAFNLASTGRRDEAVAAVERAQSLDPLSPIINADHAQILYFVGRNEEAVQQCLRTLQITPGFPEARRILFLSLVRTGHEDEALRELDAYYRLPDGGPGASVGYAYAVLGRRSEALAVLRQQESRPRKDFVPPYNLAVVHAALGDVDRAFALLDEALAMKDTETMILPVDPRLEALRKDPRFAALLGRMGLPLP
jgi:TolB-like protein/Flp pilus assembly protein TadD